MVLLKITIELKKGGVEPLEFTEYEVDFTGRSYVGRQSIGIKGSTLKVLPKHLKYPRCMGTSMVDMVFRSYCLPEDKEETIKLLCEAVYNKFNKALETIKDVAATMKEHEDWIDSYLTT